MQVLANAIRTVLLAAIIAMGVGGVAVAGPYEDAFAAYKRQDYTTAMLLFRPFADQGDAYAQSSLGFMYKYGMGVAQNDAEAAKWFRKAADQGNAYAQSSLGVSYANGWGVPEDEAEAGKTVVAPNNTCNANATLKSFIPRRMLVPRLGKY